MNKTKISILVPAFNVEAYLDECLQSLLSQTLREIEIVVVDDGSTDSTASIARRYAATDPRLRVLCLPEHQGVSAARNACLSQTEGEYLAFVDSDDFISIDAMERLYAKAVQSQADIVLGSILYSYDDGRQIRVGDKSSVFHSDDDVLTGQECFIRMQQTGCYVPMVCGNLYRTDFVKAHTQLYFEGAFHEDEYFTPYALYKAERVTDFKEDFYYYRQRPNSIMHNQTYIEHRANALCAIANLLQKFCNSCVDNNLQQAFQKNITRLQQQAQNLKQQSVYVSKLLKHTIIYTTPDTIGFRLHHLLTETIRKSNVSRICILKEGDIPIRNELQQILFFHKYQKEELVCSNTKRMILTRECVDFIIKKKYLLNGTTLVNALYSSPYVHNIKQVRFCIHKKDKINWWNIATSRSALFAAMPERDADPLLKARIERYLLRPTALTISSSGSWQSPTLLGHWFDEGLAEGINRLFSYMDVKEVGDFGCGPGWYVAYLRKNGYDADGYDGNPHVVELSSTFFDDGYYCQQVDLTEALEAEGKFDAILSLEVGEHIPSSKEDVFIGNLVRNVRNHLILSWALEGQVGDGHVNGHSNEYVISRMRQYGLVLNRPATNYLRKCACLDWFKQTVMCFDRVAYRTIPRQPEVSVIVPGYNAEAYLEKCLESIKEQTLYNLEVLMIDDGSTDGTSRIMERYSRDDIRFRYLQQENKGLSEARNTGLAHACGQYIAFVDADDFLPEDALLALCEKARKSEADIVAGNVSMYSEDGIKDYVPKCMESTEVRSGQDFLCRAVAGGRYVPMVYNYLYRRTFIERYGLRFDPGILHEDELWTPIALAKADGVASISDTTYFYRQHGASIMSTAKAARRIASIESIIRKLEEFKTNSILTEGCRRAIAGRISVLAQIMNRLKKELT